MTYEFTYSSKLENYAILKDGKVLKPEEVCLKLNGFQKEQPSYYVGEGLSPIDSFREGLISKTEFIGFCKGNVIKYVVRAGLKDGDDAIRDYEKAMDYIKELINTERFI